MDGVLGGVGTVDTQNSGSRMRWWRYWMEDRYFKLWRLMQERLARRAEDCKLSERGSTVYYSLLAEMAVLEAEAVLEE